jgi:hypothetical protein
MTTKSIAKAPAVEGGAVSTKVSKQVVELLDELTERRAIFNESKDAIEQLREEIYAIVGKTAQVLTYYNAEVGSIVAKKSPAGVDLKKLETDFPEVYAACQKPAGVQYQLNTPSQRK